MTIEIRDTTITFPTSAMSPNWTPTIVEFAEAVEKAFNDTIGPYDVAPQIQTIDTNGATDIEVTNLLFSPTNISMFVVDYSIKRTIIEGVDKIYNEAGKITCSYDDTTTAWGWTQTKMGDAKASFDVSALGQVSVTFATLDGDSATHTGTVNTRATTLITN